MTKGPRNFTMESNSLLGTEASISYSLVGLSGAILFIYILRNTIRKVLPPWLKPFAQEEAPELRKLRIWNQWTLILGIVAILGLAISVVPIVVAPRRYIGIFEMLPWLCASILTVLDRPTKTPKLLFLQYLVILFSGLATFSVRFLDHVDIPLDVFTLVRTVLALLAFLIIGNMPLRDPSWGLSNIGNPKSGSSHHVRSPEDNLSIFQFWTMNWVYPLPKIASKRELTVEDVWQLPFEFQHTRLYMAFRELKGRLLPCLIEANGLDLCLAVSCAVAEKISEVSSIRLTSKFYSALDNDNPDEAAFWCLVMFTVDLIRQVTKTCSTWYARKAYERSRGETFIALFGKLLTRAVPGSEVTEKDPNDTQKDEEVKRGRPGKFFSNCCGRKKKSPSINEVASQPASNAKVINLVRGDTYEISQRFWDFSKLISQPVKVIFTVYYLLDIMGWPSCIGFGLMLFFLVLNSMLVKEAIKLERSRTKHSDRRAQAVAHFVEASRPLKLNGWTSFWSERIMKFRDSEMLKRLQISYLNASISTVNILGGAAYPLASICLYTLILRQGLPNNVIWPSLQLFGQLEGTVKESFDLISAYWKATIPVERVNQYMAEPDRDETSLSTVTTTDIEFSDASFSRPSTEKLVLHNLTFKFTTGLTVVRGKVGSGKSSLLLAALNELEHHGGHFSRPNEPVAYAQQLPWLQNKTIRDNIVFHQQFDDTRYREVLHACALSPDLTSFRDGDQTKLEEGGIGLSGGQKARVALARAIYSHCRILLLDDPLAALDHDTAKTIVQRFLKGSLAQGRTIVLVTHRDDLVLRIADQVIDVHDGRASVLSPEQIQEELDHPYHAVSAKDIPHDAATTHEGDLDEDSGLKEVAEEATETGTVPMSIYTKYMAAGGWHLWILLAIFYGLSRYCDIARARLLEAWGQDSANQSDDLTGGYWGLPNPDLHPKAWLYALGGLSASQVATYAIAQVILARVSINAAQGLFRAAVQKVSKASFRYHDITPTGQLKNRLISDMGMVDGGILSPLESFVYNAISLTLSVVAIMAHRSSLIIILAGVTMLFVWFFRLYVPISRCLRRMEMRCLTPIIANIGVMQDGLVTIRALRVEGHFQNRHLHAVDDFQKYDHFFWSMALWLDFRLGISSALTRAILVLFMVWTGAPASAVGFVLTQTSIAVSSVQQLCEKFAALQLDAVSLERVDALNHIPEEPKGDLDPHDDWPRPRDSVKFERVCFKYADDLPAVLDQVSFEIPGGSTCAVLGRTGSGKSTIANALLATQTPFSGSIKIGSIDITRVDRTALRSCITYIQQDPILFPGSLRDNIDPEGRFSDMACLNAIHDVLGADWGLNSTIDAGGKNLSQGQRQLVGLSRAVLRRSSVVILDEATASIDRDTAAKVQRILRKELSQSTVITIAHRLEAVEDADWVLRLDHGEVIECGPTGGGFSRSLRVQR